MIGTGEARRVIDAYRDLDLASGTGREPQSRVGFTARGENGHHGPITTTEDSFERLFVHATRCGRVTGMRMQPEPEELRWSETCIHLLIEEIGHALVVEGDGGHARPLTDQPHIVDQQQVIGRADPESTDFGRSGITQKQQLRPGIRREPQYGRIVVRLLGLWLGSCDSSCHPGTFHKGVHRSGHIPSDNVGRPILRIRDISSGSRHNQTNRRPCNHGCTRGRNHCRTLHTPSTPRR